MFCFKSTKSLNFGREDGVEETEPPHTEEQFDDEPGDTQSFKNGAESMDEDHNDDSSSGKKTQKLNIYG